MPLFFQIDSLLYRNRTKICWPGKKTGWSSIEVPAELALKIKTQHESEFSCEGEIRPIPNTSCKSFANGWRFVYHPS